jgi:hypothetical protein
MDGYLGNPFQLVMDITIAQNKSLNLISYSLIYELNEMTIFILYYKFVLDFIFKFKKIEFETSPNYHSISAIFYHNNPYIFKCLLMKMQTIH